MADPRTTPGPPCLTCGAEIVAWECDPIEARRESLMKHCRVMKPGSTFHVCANGHRRQLTFVPEEPDPILEDIRRSWQPSEGEEGHLPDPTKPGDRA